MTANLCPNSFCILLVDDHANNLKVLSEAIRGCEWKALMATDGASAIEQAVYAQPDLILLDVMMPGLDGFETCCRLKANPQTEKIPIIFMTALSETVDKVKGLNLGAVDYITKPFQQDEVVARLKLHLQVSHLTRTLEQRVQERTAELERSLQQLQQIQLQLVQSEKMSALGNLVAGVAHEINNPVGFLAGNLQPAQDYMRDLFELLDLYQRNYPHPTLDIQNQIEAIDLEYLREDLPKLLDSMKLGIERIRTISTSLRTFSRADRDYKVPFDIHEGLDSTILILKHRLKANDARPEIEIIREYGVLPPIMCFPGQLNQVFMNILANAIDALEESYLRHGFEFKQDNSYHITIQTRIAEDEHIEIHIADNGVGMTDATKEQIFDYLFTTKAAGKGTGLGLAISHQIITEKHGGKIQVQSALNQGTEIAIALPIKLESAEPANQLASVL